jgi:hypothetical protein
MKYLLVLGLLIASLVTATYALKGDRIMENILKSSAKAYGTNSLVFRLQRSIVGHPAYTPTFRITASVVAICFLAASVYVLVTGHER